MHQVIDYLISKFKNDVVFKTIDIQNQKIPMIKTIHETEKVVDLEGYLDQPRFIKQNRTIYQLSSFVNYIEKFKPVGDSAPMYGKSAAFIELKENGVSVNCILDYHSEFHNPTHCKHSVELSCNIDESFKTWSRNDNAWMSQKDMINLLKKHSNALDDNAFNELLAAIEDVKSDVKLQATQKAGESGNSKSVFFKLINQFAFKFKPYFSMPFVYSTNADLYAQLDDNGRLQLKYSIRNQHKIHELVAEDLRIELGHINDLEVF